MGRPTGERPLRVLHCPADVGGHPGGLARAERELGLDSRAVSLEPVHEGYEIDEVLWRRGDGRFRRELARWRLLRRARDVDIVHFNFGSPILPRAFPSGYDSSRLSFLFRLYGRIVELRDVGWLARAGKGVVVTFQGDDARQADWCRSHFEISAAAELEQTPALAALDERRREWIRAFDRHADRIYALNPDLLHVLPARAEFLPYAHVDPREWRPTEPPADGPRPLRVVHAPSDPAVKGTRFIVAALERLRHEGVSLELELVQGLTRDQARRAYARADVAVDQLLVGWYGGVAVEQMALGKPVVCYVRDGDLGFVPSELRDELPVIRATPATIADVLRELATTRRGGLPALGHESRGYVERRHDPLRIAARLRRAYEEIAARSSGYDRAP